MHKITAADISSSGPRQGTTQTEGEELMHLEIVSHSIPEKPKAESPSMATTSRSGRAVAAAMA